MPVDEYKHRLKLMLGCLTILFVSAQIIFFSIHYQVSELIDAVVHAAFSPQFFLAKIYLPIIGFLAIQIGAYILWLVWIYFISISVAEFFRLDNKKTYLFGLSMWCLAIAALFLLNFYFYPASFFSLLFQANDWVYRIILLIIICIWMILAGIAYLNYFLTGHQHLLAIGFLLITFFLVFTSTSSRDINISSQNDKPNIILIGLDSLRPDSINSQQTPNIHHFLSRATIFTRAYTPLARTFPSWVSILTAAYPKYHGARTNLIAANQLKIKDTLANRLRRHGYETMYATDEKRFSNITHQYGFDHIIGPSMGINDFILGGLTDFPMSNLLLKLSVAQYLFPYQYSNRAASITYDPENFLELIRSGLAQRSGKPLFLTVHFCISHWPYTWADDRQAKNILLSDRYRSSIKAVDDQFKKLMEVLSQQNLLANSLVVVLSDHGVTLGLAGDRVISKKKYLGNLKDLNKISVYKLNSSKEYSFDFKNDYSFDTSYGQATDVLSLKQYQVLLAFKNFGNKNSEKIPDTVTLMDIAPTILDYLKISQMKNIDGVSLLKRIRGNLSALPHRALFIETGDKLSEIETDNIQVENVVKKKISVYRIDTQSGLLSINPEEEKKIIAAKQRAILLDDWLLAYFPLTFQTAWLNQALTLITIKPYFVLVNIHSGKWTLDLSSPFAQSAPLAKLKARLQNFYADEWQNDSQSRLSNVPSPEKIG